jgi:hypothetical protein
VFTSFNSFRKDNFGEEGLRKFKRKEGMLQLFNLKCPRVFINISSITSELSGSLQEKKASDIYHLIFYLLAGADQLIA